MKHQQMPIRQPTNMRQLPFIHAVTLFLALAILAVASSALGANLTWDPANTANGATIDPGDGAWDLDTTTNVNWNNGSGNVSWTQINNTTAAYNAIFGGADGANYTVNLDQGAQIGVSNILINSSGYAFTNSILGCQNGTCIIVADGKSVDFYNDFKGNGGGTTKSWFVGNGSTMRVEGSEGSDQIRFLTPVNGPGGVFVLSGPNNTLATFVSATVILTNGFAATPYNTVWVGNPQSVGLNGGPATNYTTGHLIVNGGSLNVSTSGIRASRNGGHGVITLINGVIGLTNASTSQQNADILFGGVAGETATYEVFGGQLNVGSQAQPYDKLFFNGSAPPANSIAILNQTGGVVRANGGIAFGASSGTSPASALDALTNSGGFLYVGAYGIALQTANAPTNIISLSGGTVGALATWSSSMPMILDGNAGNITFQCADDSGSPFNISLSGALTGPGGIYKTGPGTLALSGTNNYAGSTVVSNGVLSMATGTITRTNGDMTLDGSAGSPTLTVNILSPAQKFQMGNLTFNSGSPTIDFEYGSPSPSTAVAAIQAAGNLNFTAAPNFIVNGTNLAVGTYPLISYAGQMFGTLPNAVTLPAYCAGYVTNVAAAKTVALVVTVSTVSGGLSWGVGNGVWDIGATANWISNSLASKYTDNSTVIFGDNATGPSPITITLNTSVNPNGLNAQNLTNAYVISGSGSITGSSKFNILGGGSMTLATANTYSGGTEVSVGSRLNINNGGDSGSTAVGTGILTLDDGAVLDDTAGSNITLEATVPEIWNGNLTYLGSSNSLNTGAGGITMNANTTLTVNSNGLTVGGAVNDNGGGFKLTKGGNGALTLLAGNSYEGGLLLSGGRLNLGNGNAVGSGILTLSDGTVIDNVSGGDIALSASHIILNGSGNAMLTFPGSSGSMDFGPGITVEQNGNAASFAFNVVSNTLTAESDLTTGNVVITKTGQGIFNIDGFGTSANQLALIVNQGEADLGRIVGNAVSGASGLTVNSNALVRITGSTGDQIKNGLNPNVVSSIPLNLNTGGVFDLNGNSESVDLAASANGVIRNGASGSISTFTINYVNGGNNGRPLTLTGTNCGFDVPPADATLIINALVSGTGSLVKTGPGTLTLSDTNTYTGSTLVDGGTLMLVDPGSLDNTATISLATNTILDVTGLGSSGQTLTLNASQTVTGIGSVNGNVVSLTGSTVAPGAPLGTLTVAGNITLGGNLLINLNNTSLPTSSQLISTSGTITYGGTLTVTNVGPALAVGTTFQIFPSAVTTFSAINLVTNDANGLLYTWNNNLAANGSIQVASVTIAPLPINPVPGPIQVGVSGNTLNLGWPTNLGWILQSQTNSSSAGLGTNWVAAPNSTSETNTSVTIDPNNSSVFYRLMHP